jgi:hypothetical protein
MCPHLVEMMSTVPGPCPSGRLVSRSRQTMQMKLIFIRITDCTTGQSYAAGVDWQCVFVVRVCVLSFAQDFIVHTITIISSDPRLFVHITSEPALTHTRLIFTFAYLFRLFASTPTTFLTKRIDFTNSSWLVLIQTKRTH